jgi:diguanylate cyclase (GGDEF)-like protein
LSRLFIFPRAPSRRRAPRGEPESFAQRIDEALADRRFRALPDDLEARFQAETAQDQSRGLFRSALGAAVTYNAQLVAEWSLTPDVLPFAAALHFGLVTPALLSIAALSRSADTPLRRDVMGAAIPLMIAAQAAVAYCASSAEGAPYYLTLLAVVPILSNSSLSLSSRAAMWTTTLCVTLLAVLARAPHGAPTPLFLGSLLPICFCVVMTLVSAIQRNRESRRAWLLDLRHRLRVAEVGLEARHDPLTGLANRRRLGETAAKLWADETHHVSPIAVVLFDVDRFKAYNDLYGHLAGDECLRRVGACALEEIGAEDDVAARYGGEEFMLLLPRTPLDEARRVAERLRAAVAALRIAHAGGAELGVVTASFGVASADSGAISFEQLTADADAALYTAKRTGRNRVQIAGPAVAPKGPRAA